MLLYVATALWLLAIVGPQPPIGRLAWMAGSWKMVRGSSCVEERWTRPSNDTLIGMSRTVAAGRTKSFEFMRIESRGEDVFFVAQPGGRPPVDFKMASISDSEIVFVNPGHADHLTRIVYRRVAPHGLTARVEGADEGKPFAVDYVYRASTTGCGAR